MRWMVTGSRGMLGQDLVALLAQRGQNVLAVDKSELDITDPAAVAHLVDKVDVVVNVAAHTAVDKAESEEAAAFTINATGP
ncbi:sugar nucleotide-binding protein, partial [Aerococcus urinae]|nr:sugar nucleotide-binding protein [Aerococcus urinae]